MHLADIVMRRTTLAITGALTARDLDAIAAVAAAALGWDAARTAAEIAAATAELTRKHRLALADRLHASRARKVSVAVDRATGRVCLGVFRPPSGRGRPTRSASPSPRAGSA